MAEVKFTRTLKVFSKGDDVLYIKQCLLKLGYYDAKITKVGNSYGYDTKKAVKKFQTEHNLKVTSNVDELTWSAIVEEYKVRVSGTEFTRDLKFGMQGADVSYMKFCLHAMKYLTKTPTHNLFGNDTKNAVIDYQRAHSLDVTGVINSKTWMSIVSSYKSNESYAGTTDYLKYSDYPNITKSHLDAINKDLEGISDIRKQIVAECLRHVYDRDTNTKKPVALYIYGANLYDSNLKLFKATASYIDSRVKIYPNYFDGGRKEWMKKMVKENPNIVCSDCSGLEVGYMRKFGIISKTNDFTANYMCSSSKSTGIKKADLKPGDWVGKEGHIATYVGAGMTAEFVGGAHAGQLTDINTRKAYNFVTGTTDTMAAWTKYRRPKLYN